MKSIGIDVGKGRRVACLMDRDGTVLKETTYESTYAAAAISAGRVKHALQVPVG